MAKLLRLIYNRFAALRAAEVLHKIPRGPALIGDRAVRHILHHRIADARRPVRSLI